MPLRQEDDGVGILTQLCLCPRPRPTGSTPAQPHWSPQWAELPTVRFQALPSALPDKLKRTLPH